jgi:hypothetical protein
MNESKTPITETNTVYIGNDIYAVPIEICRRLETENAKLKSAVEELRDELSRLQSVVGEEDYAIIEQKLKDAEGLL